MIHHDHMRRSAGLLPTAQQLSERIRSVPAAHSLKFRIKNPEHLVEKIIRKSINDPDLRITLANYREQITDLIGLRVLHLFKDDWTSIHDFILSEWDLAEKPTANIRRGDPEEFVEVFKSRGCRIREHRLGYRSVHYLLRTQPSKEVHIAEVQVRTIFEEGWSEIDHAIRYPIDFGDPLASRVLGVLNRLAGGADELGAYVRYLQRANEARAKAERSALTRRNRTLDDALKKLESMSINKEGRNELRMMIEGLKTDENEIQEGGGLTRVLDFIGKRYVERSDHAAEWIVEQHLLHNETRARLVWGPNYGSQVPIDSISPEELLSVQDSEDGGTDVFDVQQRRVGRFLNTSPLDYDGYIHALKVAFGATPWRIRVVEPPYKYTSRGEQYATITACFESAPLTEVLEKRRARRRHLRRPPTE